MQNTHEISRYLGDHLSGAGNWRSQEANGGLLPQASRAKPSFTGFPDSSQTYLLAFVMPLIFDNRYFFDFLKLLSYLIFLCSHAIQFHLASVLIVQLNIVNILVFTEEWARMKKGLKEAHRVYLNVWLKPLLDSV